MTQNQNAIVKTLLVDPAQSFILTKFDLHPNGASFIKVVDNNGKETSINLAAFVDNSFQIMSVDVGTLKPDQLKFRFAMAQLELFAKLAIGRNRYSVDLLLVDAMSAHSKFNLQCPVLIQVVESAAMPAYFRQVALTLLRYLYLDREPLKSMSDLQLSLTMDSVRTTIRSTLKPRHFVDAKKQVKTLSLPLSL